MVHTHVILAAWGHALHHLGGIDDKQACILASQTKNTNQKPVMVE